MPAVPDADQFFAPANPSHEAPAPCQICLMSRRCRKLPVPPVPPGHTTLSFGKQVMQWRTGTPAACWRMLTLTCAELERQGVTADIARAWHAFYHHEAARNPANPSARGRSLLMAWAACLLEGDERQAA